MQAISPHFVISISELPETMSLQCLFSSTVVRWPGPNASPRIWAAYDENDVYCAARLASSDISFVNHTRYATCSSISIETIEF